MKVRGGKLRLRLRLLGVCQASVVAQVVASVSHKAHAHTVKGGQASWELAAAKLFVVGCDRQGLGMSLELPGVFPPHPSAPDQEWCPRFSTPASTCGKEVSFDAADMYCMSPAEQCAAVCSACSE